MRVTTAILAALIGSVSAASTYNITFSSLEGDQSGSFLCPDDEYLLDKAEESGFDWPFASRAGVDATSAARLISGSVDQSDQSLLNDDEIAAGYILTDVAYPRADCVLVTHVEEELV